MTDTILAIVNKHAPLKQKSVRGNETPFISKELLNQIYTWTRLRNTFVRNPTMNECVTLKKSPCKYN